MAAALLHPTSRYLPKAHGPVAATAGARPAVASWSQRVPGRLETISGSIYGFGVSGKIGRGGPPAIRGFRLQMLYVLHRLLCDEKVFAVELETIEDAVLLDHEGNHFEIIQVKAEGQPLGAAALRDSSLPRHMHTGTVLRLVSFSGFGQQLSMAAQGGNAAFGKVNTTLNKSEEYTQALLTQLVLTTVSESILLDEVCGMLQNTSAGFRPKLTLTLLCGWLAVAAESRRTVKRTEVFAQLQQATRLLKDAESWQTQWHQTIHPVAEESCDLDGVALRGEYHAGISARRSHILANGDTRRQAQIDRLDVLFTAARTCIIFGASGQGKTSLALRYLEERAPLGTRLSVTEVRSAEQAVAIARAIACYCDSLNTYVYVHIDATAYDCGFEDLLALLTQHPKIRLLATLRTEDWERHVTLQTRATVASLELKMEEAEALSIFEQLRERGNTRFPTFESAWQSFGGQGPLLEFTHLVTQHERLRTRLIAQANQLIAEFTDEEFTLLHTLVVATRFGGEVDLSALARSLQTHSATKIIKRLRDEYVVRQPTNSTISGLHFLRSQILTEILDRHALDSGAKARQAALLSISERDIEDYIVSSVLAGESDLNWQRELSSRQFTSWTGLGGVVKALVWFSLWRHVTLHHALLRTLTDTFGMFGTAMFTQSSWSDTDGLDSTVNLLQILRRSPAELSGYTDRLPKLIDFSVVEAWIRSLESLPSAPPVADELAWTSLAEFIFWVGTLRLEQIELRLDGNAIRELPLETALMCYSSFDAVGAFKNSTQREALRSDLGTRAKAELLLLELSYDEGEAFAVYVVTEPNVGALGPINKRSLRLVRLLYLLFPEATAVQVRAVGLIRLGDVRWDDSAKNIQRGTWETPWLSKWRSTLAFLATCEDRPADWNEAKDKMREDSQMLAAATKALQKLVVQVLQNSDCEEHLELMLRLINSIDTSATEPRAQLEASGRTGKLDYSSSFEKPESPYQIALQLRSKFISNHVGFLRAGTRALQAALQTTKGRFAQRIPLQEQRDWGLQAMMALSELWRQHEAYLSNRPAWIVDVGEGLEGISKEDLTAIWWVIAVQPNFRVKLAEQVLAYPHKQLNDWRRRYIKKLESQLRLKLAPAKIFVEEVANIGGKLLVEIDCEELACLDENVTLAIDFFREEIKGSNRSTKIAYGNVWNAVVLVQSLSGHIVHAQELEYSALCFGADSAFPQGFPFDLSKLVDRQERVVQALPVVVNFLAAFFEANLLLQQMFDVFQNVTQDVDVAVLDSYQSVIHEQLDKAVMPIHSTLDSLAHDELVNYAAVDAWLKAIANRDYENWQVLTVDAVEAATQLGRLHLYKLAKHSAQTAASPV